MSEKPGHAVNRLRDEAVARSTRPFKARGARVQRYPEKE